MKNVLIHIVLLHFLTASLNGQVLDAKSKRLVSLRDGTPVLIFSSMKDPSSYYYLPRKIQVACTQGVPEISLMIYRNERKEITGGILHVLMTWGLTPAQEKETQSIITNTVDSLGHLKGAGDITLHSGQLEFDQKNLFAKGLEKSSALAVKVPTLPVHKTAASFNLSPLVARFLVDELTSQRESKKIKMRAGYRFTTMSGDSLIKIGVEMEDEMTISLSSWIKALKRYKLMKYVSI
jgi:hypothetical protein